MADSNVLEHDLSIETAPAARCDTIVIVGNGPVGMRFCRDVLVGLPGANLIIYGEENHHPYNRVRLSSWLAGEVALDDLSNTESLASAERPSNGCRVEQRLGFRITSIDRNARTVTDQTGGVQSYDVLILATGSSPFVPSLPGIDLSGVYTLRNLDDAMALLARRARTRRTVVLGGGLLGLEAARGMQAANTDVTVVEHADRLLANQLDPDASERLQEKVEALGITLVIGDSVRKVLGAGRVEALLLRSGKVLACDTVLISAGIRPNIELARHAGLAFGRGVKVDNKMRTSDPYIYAVGECAEHNGEVYGLVAPGFEQAAVAAASVSGKAGEYLGSIAASRLKVMGTQVFSMGPMGITARPFAGATYRYFDASRNCYRKILVCRNRLAGAIGIGEWSETVRLQTQIGTRQFIYPWQIVRFVHTGRIWPEGEGASVSAWPANATICQCNGVSRGSISEAIAQGANTVEAVSRLTNASTVCGSCRPLVADLLGQSTPPEPVGGSRSLLGLGMLGLVVSLFFLMGTSLEYSSSVRSDGGVSWFAGPHWDVLWRDGFLKQVTGFGMLAAVTVSLLISLRKRWARVQRLGKYDYWRVAHIGLGIMVVVGLVAHTGFRLGSGLNFLLMLSFLGLLFVGSVSSVVISAGHRLDHARAARLRRQSVFVHILLFWPVPVFLAWHVFKTYWY
ncbi:MAG: FAD-dependent oxidoreductase [Burkholderiaceae bacterium]